MNVTASGATKAMVSHTAIAREWGMGFHGDVAPWLGHVEVEGVSDYGAEIPPMETVIPSEHRVFTLQTRPSLE